MAKQNFDKSLIVRFNMFGTPSVGTKYYFTNDLEVNNATLRGLQIPETEVELSQSFNFSNSTPITFAQMQYCFITLCNTDNVKIYDQLSLYTFMASRNNGILRNFMNAKIDVSKSYVTIADVGAAAITSAQYLLIKFLCVKDN